MKHKTQCPYCYRHVRMTCDHGMNYIRLHRVPNGTKVCQGTHKRVAVAALVDVDDMRTEEEKDG